MPSLAFNGSASGRPAPSVLVRISLLALCGLSTGWTGCAPLVADDEGAIVSSGLGQTGSTPGSQLPSVASSEAQPVPVGRGTSREINEQSALLQPDTFFGIMTAGPGAAGANSPGPQLARYAELELIPFRSYPQQHVYKGYLRVWTAPGAAGLLVHQYYPVVIQRGEDRGILLIAQEQHAVNPGQLVFDAAGGHWEGEVRGKTVRKGGKAASSGDGSGSHQSMEDGAGRQATDTSGEVIGRFRFWRDAQGFAGMLRQGLVAFDQEDAAQTAVSGNAGMRRRFSMRSYRAGDPKRGQLTAPVATVALVTELCRDLIDCDEEVSRQALRSKPPKEVFRTGALVAAVPDKTGPLTAGTSAEAAPGLLIPASLLAHDRSTEAAPGASPVSSDSASVVRSPELPAGEAMAPQKAAGNLAELQFSEYLNSRQAGGTAADDGRSLSLARKAASAAHSAGRRDISWVPSGDYFGFLEHEALSQSQFFRLALQAKETSPGKKLYGGILTLFFEPRQPSTAPASPAPSANQSWGMGQFMVHSYGMQRYLGPQHAFAFEGEESESFIVVTELNERSLAGDYYSKNFGYIGRVKAWRGGVPPIDPSRLVQGIPPDFRVGQCRYLIRTESAAADGYYGLFRPVGVSGREVCDAEKAGGAARHDSDPVEQSSRTFDAVWYDFYHDRLAIVQGHDATAIIDLSRRALLYP